MSKTKAVDFKTIEAFLEGSNDQKYVVAIEGNYHTNKVDLIINDPITGKRTITKTYKPFLWFNDEVNSKLYGGSTHKKNQAYAKHGITVKKLRTTSESGFTPKRMESGYKYLAESTKSYNELLNFFKFGGIDIFKEGGDNKKHFTMFSPAEQYMIQTGTRFFKGFEDYNELHRLQFDLETEGLNPATCAISQIGIRVNIDKQNPSNDKGRFWLLQTVGNNPQERRDSERLNIVNFFKSINALKPDIIAGYNSENFDWKFLFERCERLSIPITGIAITLSNSSQIKRKDSPIKFGGTSEKFQQTSMFGYNIIDVSHAVRRAMAINSDIKNWNLKYITKYSEVAEPNRVYVPGDQINTIWADVTNQYAIDEKNGDWYRISEENPLKDGYKVTIGNEIVKQYLRDDLLETEKVDYIFNQASFLISKLLPTSFQRSSTMGTAGQWKLIMSAWSYEQGLAIPALEKKRDFTGGLSRLLRVGFSRKFGKLDFAALYPKTELTHDIFPDLDISGAMEGLLTYIVDTRDRFKNLAGDEKKIVKELQKDLKENGDKYTPEEKQEKEKELALHKKLHNEYDKKQLPLKILANSWFGSYGAPYIFNWGDSDCAEETTCTGRQYLRRMVKFFKNKYHFIPLVLDTDGCNFEIPDTIDSVSYKVKANHWKTNHLPKDHELTGIEAALADFNENQLPIGSRMGLDIDDIGNASINFARKNYANDIDGKIKLVGNSVKSAKMSAYIEDFLQNGIRLLLDDKGYEFLQYYNDYVDRIYNQTIPLVKIASKAKIKRSIKEYEANRNKTNKAGNPMPKQAHMELTINAGLEVDLGDTIFYVNTGKKKSDSDLKTETDKVTKEKKTTLNCKLIDNSVIERDNELLKELAVLKSKLEKGVDENGLSMDVIKEKIESIENTLYTDTYNVGKYLSAFNKKVKPLLVCFDPSIREQILLEIVKISDKKTKTKTEKLQDKNLFTREQCKLMSGVPYKPTDQDNYDDLMIMEDKEIRFWDSVNKVPTYMEETEWEILRKDYKDRKIIQDENDRKNEIEKMEELIRRMEVSDFNVLKATGAYPDAMLKLAYESQECTVLVSKIWNIPLCTIEDILKGEKYAIARNNFYIENADKLKTFKQDKKYDKWLIFLSKQAIMTGNTTDIVDNIVVETDIEKVKNRLKLKYLKNPDIYKEKKEEIVEEIKVKAVANDEDSDDEDDEDSEGENNDEKVITEDEVDDTVPDKPDDYDNTTSIEIEEIIQADENKEVINKANDDWGF